MTAQEIRVRFGDLAMELRKMPLVGHTAPLEGHPDPVHDALSVAIRHLIDEELFSKPKHGPNSIQLGKRLMATLAFRLGYFADDCELPRLRSFYRLVTRCKITKKDVVWDKTKKRTTVFTIRDGDGKVVARDAMSRQEAWRSAVDRWIKTHGVPFFEDMARDLSVWRIRSVMETTVPYSSGKGGTKKHIALTPPSKGK